MEDRRQRPEEADAADGPVPIPWYRQTYRLHVLGAFFAIVFTFSLISFFLLAHVTDVPPTYPEYTGRPMDDILTDEKLNLSFAVIPVKYDLTVIPILDDRNNTIIGNLSIRLECRNETTFFRLHTSVSISKIYNVSMIDSKSQKLLQLHFLDFNRNKEFYEIHTTKNLQPNNTYMLHMMYIASMSNASNGTGLFKSSYVEPVTNSIRWIAISNLSPTFARTVFPCFDIPGIKASFQIKIGRKSESTLRSHTNAKQFVTVPIKGMTGYVLDEYEEIHWMPTYTIAIMITDFVHYNLETSSRITFSVISRKEVAKNTRYITALIPKLVNQMEELTSAKYTLVKLDVIVVPQLGYSAMENWGLIAIREDFILVQENSTFIKQNKRLKKFVLAHEIAHQWFGNTVTPASWSEVWIKEGFSFFFAFKALAMIDPTWTDSYLFNLNQHLAFAPWLKNSEYPLRRSLNNTNDVQNIFTEWLYLKSNFIVNMLFHSFGKKLFFNSIKQLFKWHSHHSPHQDVLCDIFQHYINERNPFPPNVTMKQFLESWTDQSGFPIVHINRNFDNKTVTATQIPFQYFDVKSKNSNLWIIPLTWTTRAKQNYTTAPKIWLVEKTTVLEDPSFSLSFSDDMWILANINRTGHYRVNYDENNWKLLLNYYDKFPKVTKLQLICDAIAIAETGLLEYKVAWLFLEKLKDEYDLSMWSIIIKTELEFLMRKLYMNTSFRYVMSVLVDNVYNSIASKFASTIDDEQMGFEEDILKFACTMDHEACLKNAHSLVQSWLEFGDSHKVPERLQSWAYCAAMKIASESEWHMLLSKYELVTDREKTIIAAGLGCFHNSAVLKKYLLSSIQTYNYLRSIDVEPALSSVIMNIQGYETSNWFLLNFFSDFETRVNHDDAIMSKMVINFSQYATTEKDLNMLETFKSVLKTDTFQSCQNYIIHNIKWRRKYETKVRYILSYGKF